MNDRQKIDQAVEEPSADLLGMEADAEKLAKYIERYKPPFTIGVYGEWGDGKTSFVNLLKHYLKNQRIADDPDFKFVSFSAWPYTTSDELWRALIITIADYLYPHEKKQVQEEKRQAQTKPTSFRHQLAAYLRQDALILNRSHSDGEDPLEKYKQLLEKLDRTAYGSISKSADHHWRINQEMGYLA